MTGMDMAAFGTTGMEIAAFGTTRLSECSNSEMFCASIVNTPKSLVLPIGVGVTFDIALDAGFTPILSFPHQGGRDKMTYLNTCR